MRKTIILLIITCIITLTSACSSVSNTNVQQEVNLDDIARVSKLFDDDSKLLTKNDMAVWLVKIINYYNVTSNNDTPIEDKTRKDLLSDAISLRILHGSNDNDIDDEKPSTREEAFTMIDRAFRLNPPMELGKVSKFKDYSKVSTWAADSVHNVVTIVLNSNEAHLFDAGIQPASFISQDEMIHIITPVIKSPYCNIPELGIWDWIVQHVVLLLEILGIPIIAIIAFVYRNGIKRFFTWVRIRKNIIYIGDSACGKTELSKALPDPTKIRQRLPYSPTRGIYKTEPIVIKDSSGKVIFHGIPIDTPGDSNDALLQILTKNKLGKLLRRKTTIILLLAHTKSYNDNSIDDEYLKEQYEKIDKVYLPAIIPHLNNIDKVVVFINKCDLLAEPYPQDWDGVQNTIYKQHFDLLYKHIPDKLRVAFGSATKRNGIDKLRNLLL